MYYLQDYDYIIALVVGLFIFLFILFIYALACLVSIKNDIKQISKILEEKQWQERNLS